MPLGTPPPPGSSRPTGPAGLPPPPVGWTAAASGHGQSSMLDGKVFVGTGGANPVQFPAAPVTEDVVVEGFSANAASVWLGTSQGAQPWEIPPGGNVTVAPDNLQELWLSGTVGDGVCYFGK